MVLTVVEAVESMGGRRLAGCRGRKESADKLYSIYDRQKLASLLLSVAKLARRLHSAPTASSPLQPLVLLVVLCRGSRQPLVLEALAV